MRRLPAVLAQVCLLITCLCLVRPAAAQSPAAWAATGRVVDAAGLAVPGATVVVVNARTGFERVLTSDAAGRFGLADLRGRAYRVIASLTGFESARADVTPSAAEAVLVLRPATHVEQVTVVSGSRVEERRATLHTRVDVVSGARLEPTARASVGEVLREVPGVITRRGTEGSAVAGQQVQGLDSRQVAVLIDGQPIPGARGVKSGVINLDRQPVDQLDRIEVVKGASSALFGSDAIGGAINLITRQPDAPLEVSASAGGGQFGIRDHGLSAGGTRRGLSFYAAAGRHERDSFDLSPATPDTTGSALARNSAFGKLGLRPWATVQITATGSGYWNRQRGRFIGETGLRDNDIRDRASTAHATVDWQPASRTTVQARVYASRYREDSVNRPLDGAGEEIGRLRESLVKSDVTLGQVVGERQYVQAGVEWFEDHYDGINRLRDDAGHAASTAVVWAQDRVSVHERVTMTVGARYDRHSVFGSELSPRAGVNVRAARALHLRVSYGEGFRAPDLGQLYYRFVPSANIYQVIGNPALSPETSRSWQYGADYSGMGGRLRLGINGFRNEAFDLITAESLGFLTNPRQLANLIAAGRLDPSFAPVFGRLLLVYRNIADVRTQGVEIDGELALGRGIAVAGAYTHLDAIDREAGIELTGRHRHHGAARVTWADPRSRLRAELRGAFYGSWLVTAGERAEAFALWDALAAYRVGPQLEVFLAVDNAFDSQDPQTGTGEAIFRPDIGRTWRTGVRWTWRQR